jgi:CDP-4-dehydro-6-deoxyglucose reductase, E1
MHKWPLINDNINNDDKEKLSNFILSTNRFTNGPKVKEFEKKWSNWLGVKHSVFVNSGASANYIMSAILKEKQGIGEVIVPPIAWVSDIAPLVQMGMTPVFVDVCYENMAITYENIRNAITDKTVGIVLVHVLGFNAITDEIIKICKEKNIMLLEDCCESHGSTFKNKKNGNFGHMSNFSFYFGHHMTTIEGGMVCTNDDELLDYIKLFRSHGMTRECSEGLKEKYNKRYPELNPLFTFAVPGFNMRNTEINAVLGLNQIKRLDNNISVRSKNLNYWLDNLDPEKYFVKFNRKGSSNFSLPLIIKLKNVSIRNNVIKILEDEDIEYRLGTAGGGNQERQPYLREGKYSYRVSGKLNNANHIHEFGLYLGNHTGVSKEMIIRLCKKLNKAWR